AEAQRSLSAVAADIQSATRGQAEALVHLVDRIERVEKNTENTPMRDAVRGLHQAVARLTEQIGRTSAESSGQVGVLASGMEAMAVKVASVRDESVRLERLIDDRLNALSERVGQMEERVRTPSITQEMLEARIDQAENRMREAFAQHLAMVERNFGLIAARLD